MNNSGKNKSQKWLSINKYETVDDPPDVVPTIVFPDSPPKISTDGKKSISPQAAPGLYESVPEDRSNLANYEREMEEVSSLTNLPVSDEPPVESDLYAYACADDVRKVVLKDKPKFCYDYSTVHDSRGSELLYSEVGMWDGVQEQAGSGSGTATCGLATVEEATGGMKPDNNRIEIYQLAKDPDADTTENQSQLPIGDCHSETKTPGKEKTRTLNEALKMTGSAAMISTSLNITENYTKAESDNSVAELNISKNRTIGLKIPPSPKECPVLYGKVDKPHCVQLPQKLLPSPPPLAGNSTVFESSSKVLKLPSDLYTIVEKPQPKDAFSISPSISAETGASDVVRLDTNSPTLSNSTKGRSRSDRIPKLPNPRISSKHQSPFDEIRTVVGEKWESREVDELQSKGAPKGASAVDELRQFLQKLDK